MKKLTSELKKLKIKPYDVGKAMGYKGGKFPGHIYRFFNGKPTKAENIEKLKGVVSKLAPDIKFDEYIDLVSGKLK